MKIINDILKDKWLCKLKRGDDDGGRVNEGEMRDNNCNLIGNKRGQLSIFIIVAVIIVAGVVVYLAASGKIGGESIPVEFAPIYEYYASCIEGKTGEAIDLVLSQGGYIDPGEYAPGSDYAPFSNHLNFLGFPVPYWQYISANGVIKEQVPGKRDMEDEIAGYVESRIVDCDFEQFYVKGFSIEFGEIDAKVNIEEDKVNVNINQRVGSGREDSDGSALKSRHEVIVESKLGRLYNEARKVYEKQKEEAFLEGHAIDVLRLYAPVDGVEISCNGKIWKTREVAENIKEGLEANIQTLKIEGDYYSLQNKEREYFVISGSADEPVRFLYSREWPSKLEIHGADDELMIAEPVGNQEGLGILGFCYAPYHFVYDLSFPVLIQIGEGEETFQFPVVAIIDKNLAREGIYSENNESIPKFDICSSMSQEIEVQLFDASLNEVDGSLSYSCFDQGCGLGRSENGRWQGKAPACVNGYLEVRAEGFAEKKELVSTNRENKIEVILDKEHEAEIELEINGKKLEGNAIVTFAGEKTKSAALPEVNKIKLSEGSYNVSVFVYGNSSLTIPGSKKEQCTEVASSGFLGVFGGTREECFEIEIPGMKVEYALVGGGKEEHYLLESELEKGKMKIKVQGLPSPSSIEELQNNFEAFELMGVDIEYG